MKNLTKDKILTTAEELFQKRGANDVSFQEISDIVGIRKPSLYHHFSSKKDLICQLIDHCQENYGKAYNNIALGNQSAFEKLAALTKVFEKGLEGGKTCLMGMLSAERESLATEPQEALEKAILKTLEIITQIFEQGKKDKTVNCHSSPTNMALMFFSFLQGAQLSSRAIGGQKAFRKMAQAMLQTLKA